MSNLNWGLYQSSITNNEEAAFILTEEHLPINPEIYSYIAASHFKLRNPRKAITFFIQAKKYDKSPELASKIGNCRFYLLYEELNKGSNKEELTPLIRETKISLEEAIKKNTATKGDNIYPYFILGKLSREVAEYGLNTADFGLESPQVYISKALETYNENNSYWSVKTVGKRSKNFVCAPLDNYGLLEPIFIFKRGKFGELNEELEMTKILNEKLEEKLGNSRKFFVPSPFNILEHKDEGEKFTGTYYVMSKEDGTVLEDLLDDPGIGKEQKLDILKDVSAYLSFIHSSLPKPETPEFKCEEYIEERLTKKGIEVAEAIENIQKLISSDSSDSDMAQYLLWDKMHQVCLGDKDTVI